MIVLSTFDLSLVCYDMALFVVLLQRFICVRTIQTGKTYLISRIYQIMVISILEL